MSGIWYRGTPNRTNDPSNFRGDIIWFTNDFKYAKSYATAYEGVVVRATLTCENTFDAGVTDDSMCRLVPLTFPFKLSSQMVRLLDKLDMSEDNF